MYKKFHGFILFLSILVIYSNLFGQITFMKTYGGDLTDRSRCIKEISDSGYIITGAKDIKTRQSKLLILRTDSFGDTLWTKAYNFSSILSGDYIIQTHDKGFVISGSIGDSLSSSENQLLLKTDSKGDTLWTKKLGFMFASYHCVIEKSDGSLFTSTSVLGPPETGSADSSVYPGIIKTDMKGNVIWKKGLAVPGKHGIYYMIETEDGGFLLACSGALVIKADSLCNMLWFKVLMPKDELYQLGPHLLAVTSTDDKGYLFAGSYEVYKDYTTKEYTLLVKTNSNGDTIWTKIYTDTTGFAESVDRLPFNQGFIISGRYGDDAMLQRLDPEGNTLWRKLFKFPGLTSAISFVKHTFDKGYAACGNFSGGLYGRKSDILLIKTDDKGNITGINEDNAKSSYPSEFILHQNYPNPFNPSTTITYQLSKACNVNLRVYDILGRNVITLVNTYQNAGEYKVQFDAASLPSGIYIYSIQAGEFSDSRKLMLVK